MTTNVHTLMNPAEKAEDQVFCYTQKLAGYSTREIAEQYEAKFGKPISHTTVSKRIRDEAELRVQPLAEQFREIELARIDLYLTKIQKKIDEGDDKAINTAIRLSESRRKLLGIDAPQRVDLQQTTITSADTEIGRLILEQQKTNQEVANRLKAMETYS